MGRGKETSLKDRKTILWNSSTYSSCVNSIYTSSATRNKFGSMIRSTYLKGTTFRTAAAIYMQAILRSWDEGGPPFKSNAGRGGSGDWCGEFNLIKLALLARGSTDGSLPSGRARRSLCGNGVASITSSSSSARHKLLRISVPGLSPTCDQNGNHSLMGRAEGKTRVSYEFSFTFEE